MFYFSDNILLFKYCDDCNENLSMNKINFTDVQDGMNQQDKIKL
jgi:hypothetical protein